MFDSHATLKADSLQHLARVATLARAHGRDIVARQIGLHRDAVSESRYNIAIVGDMKRGKSTLLNVLLGRRDDDLSPIQSKVCTSSIVRYQNREAQCEATVNFDNGRDSITVPPTEVREYITEEGNPKNEKQVRTVDVFGNFPLLGNVVTLVDTPGRGAVHRHHEILLEQFMPVADAVILLICADLPVTASEREFLEQLREQEKKRIFFVLTKRDEVQDKDVSEVRHYVRKQIHEAGLVCNELYEVSARQVFEAVRSGKPTAEIAGLRRTSGIEKLESSLELFILSKAGEQTLMPRLRTALEYENHFLTSILGELEEQAALLQEGTGSISTEITALQSQSRELIASCDRKLAQFERQWNQHTAKFHTKLKARSGAVSDRVIQRMGRGGLIGSWSKSFSASRSIQNCLNEEIEPLLADLNLSLGDCVATLTKELGSTWDTHIRTRVRTDLSLPAMSMIGAGTTVSTFLAAGAQVASAAGAWMQVPVATSSAGFFPWVWAALAGGGNAAGATAAAVAATGPAVLAVVTFVATVWLAKNITAAIQENRVPNLVDDAIEQMISIMAPAMDAEAKSICETHQALIEEELHSYSSRLVRLEQTARDADPHAKERIELELAEVRSLLQEQRDLTANVALLSKTIS